LVVFNHTRVLRAIFAALSVTEHTRAAPEAHAYVFGTQASEAAGHSPQNHALVSVTYSHRAPLVASQRRAV